MDVVEKQNLATLLDQVCLLGVLWQLELFEYGKLFIDEGFDDLETLSGAARHDFKSLKLRRVDARKLKTFLNSCRSLSHVLPLDARRPLDSWGLIQTEEFERKLISARVGNTSFGKLRLPSALSIIDTLPTFFRTQNGGKASKILPRSISGALADIPQCKSVIEKSRDAAVAWMETSCRISRSPSATQSPSPARQNGYTAPFPSLIKSQSGLMEDGNDFTSYRDTTGEISPLSTSPLNRVSVWPINPLLGLNVPPDTSVSSSTSPLSSGTVSSVASPQGTTNVDSNSLSTSASTPIPSSYAMASTTVASPLRVQTYPVCTSTSPLPPFQSPVTNPQPYSLQQPWTTRYSPWNTSAKSSAVHGESIPESPVYSPYEVSPLSPRGVDFGFSQ